jgi:hypothetical protein
VNKQYVVALEYIYYQNNCKYVEIEGVPESDQLHHYPLGTESYR